MHILLLHQYFLDDDQGGGSRWNEMARVWVAAGHKVTVLAGTVHYMTKMRSETWFKKSINRDGITVVRCYVSSSYHTNFLGRFWGYFSFVFSAIAGGMFYTKEHYDCIIVTSPPLFAGFPALVLSWIKRLPLVTEIRDLWPESAIETGVLKNEVLIRLAYRFEKYLYQKSSLITVLTPAFRAALVCKGIREDKLLFIPNAADFALVDRVEKTCYPEKLRLELGVNDQLILIYVGAHGLANGLDQVIDAAVLLKQMPVHFLLIGDGKEKQRLIENVKKLGLGNITFLPPVPKSEVFRYILAADAGLSVLKKAEVFKTVYSNKTFDYFSCKKPVLTAIDGASRKLIEDAQAGLFIEPENPDDFARQVLFYLNNRELLRQHGENGYRFARMHFDREQLAMKYLLHLEKVVASGSF